MHTNGPLSEELLDYSKGMKKDADLGIAYNQGSVNAVAGYIERQSKKAAKLEATNASTLEALELIMRCDEKGFINLKPAWHNQVRQAIRKAKGD